MTRILVAGLAPLPFEATPKSYGPGARTWQLARGLAAGGHEVAIVAMRIRDAYSREAGEEREKVDGIEILRVEDAEFLHGDTVAREFETLPAGRRGRGHDLWLARPGALVARDPFLG